jgi:hypothetical protein
VNKVERDAFCQVVLDVRIKNKRTEIAGKQERNRGEIIDWKKRERKDEVEREGKTYQSKNEMETKNLNE